MIPILIYQMGKVGSTTIKNTLDFYSILNYQIHYLNESALAKIEDRHRKKNLKIPLHIRRSQEVIEKRLLENETVKVISLVRDPVARNVSAFFQNIESYYSKSELGNITVEELIDTFLTEYPHQISINWFEKEFKESLGIDVCEIVSDKKSKFFLHKKNNIELLLMKVEASSEEKATALAQLVDLPSGFELVSGNIGDEKSYSEIYSRFKSKIKFPDSYLNAMYDSKLIKSLYSNSDIESMRKRWV